MIPRRLLLKSALAAIAGASIAAPHVALGFRIEEDASSPRARLLLDACEPRSAHDRLIAQLLADLEPSQGAEKATATVRGMDCPLCGCRLGLAMPDAGEPPRF
ncbi:MAG: hypothetical protein FJX57_06140 [Alphaproteobacteria bacterium]|nr:hypothetical protein [Alphaproteobacteria bacterium]